MKTQETWQGNNTGQSRAAGEQWICKLRRLFGGSAQTLWATSLVCCFALSGIASAACGSAISLGSAAAVPTHSAFLQPMGTLSAASQPNDSIPTIVGLWHVKFISGGQLYDEGFDQWHSDQSEILNDITPPINGNVCLGVWQKTGPLTYKLTHPAWNFDNSGNLIGTIRLQEAVTLNADGSSYQGPFSFIFFDLAGHVTSEVSGTLKAQRITVN
jgi:hypothetical protein